MSGCVSSSSGFPPGVILCTFVAFEGLCLAFYCVTNLNLVHCEENHKNRYSCILKRYFAQHFWYNIYIVQFRVFHTCVGYSFVCMCVCVCVCVCACVLLAYISVHHIFFSTSGFGSTKPPSWLRWIHGLQINLLATRCLCFLFWFIFFVKDAHVFSVRRLYCIAQCYLPC